MDSGAHYVIVEIQGHSHRVSRQDIIPQPIPELQCVETERGWCALQRQSRTVTRKELAEGVFTTCARFVSTRSRSQKRTPTCPSCLAAVHSEAR